MLVYYIIAHHLNGTNNVSLLHNRGDTRKARPFLHLIGKLCLKTCLTLDKLPQVDVKDRVYSSSTLHHIISISKNRAKLKCLKTKQDGKSKAEEVDDEDEI